jgi:hypothetical protein
VEVRGPGLGVPQLLHGAVRWGRRHSTAAPTLWKEGGLLKVGRGIPGFLSQTRRTRDPRLDPAWLDLGVWRGDFPQLSSPRP